MNDLQELLEWIGAAPNKAFWGGEIIEEIRINKNPFSRGLL